jgi:tRNA G18 (ribose-2'-O)-methylase SpoU
MAVAAGLRVRSVLVTARGLRALGGEVEAIGAPVYLAEEAVVAAVCGFDFHRGALAAVERPLPADPAALAGHARLLLAVEGVTDHENLGALFRNAAAFGAGGVLLDPTTPDPLYRRSVRVSMGHVLRVPFARPEPWPGWLAGLRDGGVEVLALTPAADAEDLRAVSPRPPQALLVGSEGRGLSAAALAAASRRVRIPLAPGVDSLNVATAAAIALHHLSYPAGHG